jgi:8-oxo-dGTP pyrophosphatase MutT (NUDIX family)
VGKDTQNQTILKREFSSGGVVFRKLEIRNSKFETRWLVAASAPSQLYPKVVWRLPKGWIDDEGGLNPGPMASGKVKADEKSLQKSAVREVKEEGGIKAKVIKKIGTEKYFFITPGKEKILKFVTFYLMEWTADLPEGFGSETSAVEWLPFEEAYRKLSFAGEREILKKAKELLDQVLVA